MMVPLCLETVRCLEDGIVETAADADMGLIYGIGFPRFRGGALRYIDTVGVAEFVAIADKYAECGPMYHPTGRWREMAANGQKVFGYPRHVQSESEVMSLNPRCAVSVVYGRTPMGRS